MFARRLELSLSFLVGKERDALSHNKEKKQWIGLVGSSRAPVALLYLYTVIIC